MAAKRERGFKLQVTTYSTKRAKCRKELVNLTQVPAVTPSTDTIHSLPTPQTTLSIPDCDTDFAVSKYQQRRDADAAEWSSIREELVTVVRSLEEPTRFFCSLCNSDTTNPIRCLDCCTSFLCCAECEARHHSQVLHKPEIWNVIIFNAIFIVMIYQNSTLM